MSVDLPEAAAPAAARPSRALRDYATYLPSQVLPALAGLVALPVIARRLSPSDLGVLALAQTLMTLGWTVVSQWLTTAAMRELPRGAPGFARTFRRGLALCGAFFLLYCGIVLVAAAISHSIADTYWYVVAGALGLTLHAIAITLFAAELRPRAYAIADVLARAGGIAVGIALVFLGHGLHAYLLGVAAALLVVGAVALAVAWPHAGDAAVQDIRAWLAYGVPVATGAIVVWFLLLVDRYLLAWLKSTAAVGVYSVGNVIGDKAVALPTFAFFVAARPLLVRAFEQGGRRSLEETMRSYTRVMILLGLPAVALAITTARPLVPLVTGHATYGAASAVVPIVAAGSFVFALASIANAGLVIARRTLPLVYAALVGLAANVGANLALIPSLGVKGAAIATPVGNVAYLGAAQLWARRDATWRIPLRTSVLATVGAGLGVAAGLLARGAVSGRFAEVVAAGAATLAVYAAVAGGFAIGTRSS